MQEWSHNTGGIVAYLRKISAPCVSGYAGTHTRIIIRIMVVFLFCTKRVTEFNTTMQFIVPRIHHIPASACDSSSFCKETRGHSLLTPVS